MDLFRSLMDEHGKPVHGRCSPILGQTQQLRPTGCVDQVSNEVVGPYRVDRYRDSRTSVHAYWRRVDQEVAPSDVAGRTNPHAFPAERRGFSPSSGTPVDDDYFACSGSFQGDDDGFGRTTRAQHRTLLPHYIEASSGEGCDEAGAIGVVTNEPIGAGNHGVDGPESFCCRAEAIEVPDDFFLVRKGDRDAHQLESPDCFDGINEMFGQHGEHYVSGIQTEALVGRGMDGG